MGEIFFAGKETQIRPALVRDVVANCATEHRISGFKSVENGSLGDWPVDFERNLGAGASKRSQVKRQNYADHGSVWTSTDSTLGRSWTIVDQLSPESAEAYTWPPVVPK